jgi:hypothetical protein
MIKVMVSHPGGVFRRLFLSGLLLAALVSCATQTNLGTQSIPIPPPPPLPRLLTAGLLERTAPEALQYYISASVTLEYVGIPDYPDSISVKNHAGIQDGNHPLPPVVIDRDTANEKTYTLGYQFSNVRDFQQLNPNGIASIDYGTLSRIVFIPAMTGGVLLNNWIDEADNRRVLEIGFERNNNSVLSFKEDESGEYFYLIPADNGSEIQYEGHTYRQLIRERPILMVRVEENIGLSVHRAEGRIPVAVPRRDAR